MRVPVNEPSASYYFETVKYSRSSYLAHALPCLKAMIRTRWNPEWSQAVERVARLIETLFHCRVQFLTIESFLQNHRDDFPAQDLIFLESTLFTAPPVLRSYVAGTLMFPLKVRRAGVRSSEVGLVGAAVVSGLAASDDERVLQIGEFLQLAVEAKLDAFERLLEIEQQENELKVLNEVEKTGKVLQLFKEKVEKQNIFSDLEPIALKSYGEQLKIDRPLLLVRTENEAPTSHKLALEIFNRTGLWFFVSIDDLTDDTFHTAEGFRDLGRLCVFIPDLSKVSIERQMRLCETFSRAGTSGADHPRLIAAISEDPVALVGRGLLLPHVISLFETIDVRAGRTAQQAVSEVEKLLSLEATPSAGASNAADSQSASLIPLTVRFQNDETPPTFH